MKPPWVMQPPWVIKLPWVIEHPQILEVCVSSREVPVPVLPGSDPL